MPASVMNSVASSTRKRLRADHSIILAIMSVALVLVLRLHLCDHEFARLALDDLEADRAARLDTFNQRRIGQREVHGHAWPPQRFDRLVRDAHRAVFVDGLEDALCLMADSLVRLRSSRHMFRGRFRCGEWSRAGRGVLAECA